jgi:tetratricopeptide (TPR) repeat protein
MPRSLISGLSLALAVAVGAASHRFALGFLAGALAWMVLGVVDIRRRRAWAHRAEAAVNEGDPERARAFARRLAKTDPVVANFLEGISFALEERVGEALPFFEQVASRQSPLQLAARGNLAWCLADLGQAARAVELAEACLTEAHARSPEVFANEAILGKALLRAGRTTEALPLLRHALGASPGTAPQRAAWAILFAEALMVSGAPEEARGVLEQAIAQAPARLVPRLQARLASR